MVERILILLAFGLLLAAGYGVWRRLQARRAAALATAAVPTALAGTVAPGRPNLLYFTTEQCAQCRFQQAPILNQLQKKVDVVIHKLDAVEQETLASFYGVLTVPATVVLDPQLRPVAINHGVAPLPKLQAQLRQAGRPELAAG